MFEKITQAPADPILGLTELFNKDSRSAKINLGIGVYKDEKGKTPILNCVKKAENVLLETENSKNYLGIDGIRHYADATQILLFDETSEVIQTKRACTVQAPGGTGALHIAAEFLFQQGNTRHVWISNPTWPNHHSLFKASGFEIHTYRYYDAENHTLDFDGMQEDLQRAQAGDIVLFHGCCHNPTGIDPSLAQWADLSELCRHKQLLPFFDFAYQGFSIGIDQDAAGLRLFVAEHPEIVIASSYSKNFGLYNERVGALTVVTENSSTALTVLSQIKTVIRVNYSNPPAHGGLIVSTILNDQSLKEEWMDEVTAMRTRIQRMRQLFVKTLQEKGAKQDFSFITKQNGMFSFSGLTTQQVQQLRDEFGVYAVSSGRINVAAMTLDNMCPLCEAIVNVL